MSSLLVAGVDEVGRGPLAGPVITAAVILPVEFNLPGLNDSKKISAKRRDDLSVAIKEQALAWSFGEANVTEIDDLNILHATMLAMQRAVASLSVRPDSVIVDGNRCPDFAVPAQALIGGDGLHSAISAASIIAKVERDSLMKSYALQYPGYGFERNSGYPTKQHRDALIEYGVTPIHRRSFAPVKALL
jgi:ribonuclease HII